MAVGVSSSRKESEGPRGKAKPPYRYTIPSGNEAQMLREVLGSRSWWVECGDGQSRNLWWGANGQRVPGWPAQGQDSPRQMVNRVQGNKEVCTKTGLAANLSAIARAAKATLPWVPYTLTISGGKAIPAREVGMLKAATHELEAEEGKVWLCKPGFMNRGRGIEIFDRPRDVLTHLAKQRSGSTWIVQKYIERPLLVQGRKFDIRAFVLVAPDKRVYLYKEGYIRTTCFEYKLDNLADKFVHLTNDAYQKTSADFGKFEDANKLSYSEFEAAVNGAVDMEKGVFPQLQACLATVFQHVIGKLNPMRLEYCFELFGIDFMLDDAGRAYLIEMNTSPALFRKGWYLQEMLPRMIEEVVQKCVDPVFPPPKGATQAERLDTFLQIVPPLVS